MINSYEKQVRLLLRILPFVDYDHPDEQGNPYFALKGGTALNFFVRNIPRLSVDIDLAYCPIDDRDVALKNINRGMKRLASRLKQALPGASIDLHPVGEILKVLVRHGGVSVKVEPNGVIRGTVYKTDYLRLQPEVEERFKMAAEVR